MGNMKELRAFVAPWEISSTRRQLRPRRFSSLMVGNVISPTASTALVADNSVVSAPTSAVPGGVYDAVLPQTETLVGMVVIVGLCVVLYFVWSEEVVPVSRTKLAISKNRGDVREYLDDLKASADPANAGVDMINGSVDVAESFGTGPKSFRPSSERHFERWLFTDWLKDNKSERKGGRQKEPALPILKDATWNSGDNPVVVAALLMILGLLFTALTERISDIVQH